MILTDRQGSSAATRISHISLGARRGSVSNVNKIPGGPGFIDIAWNAVARRSAGNHYPINYNRWLPV
jgi:hypothetical protein